MYVDVFIHASEQHETISSVCMHQRRIYTHERVHAHAHVHTCTYTQLVTHTAAKDESVYTRLHTYIQRCHVQQFEGGYIHML